LGKGFLREFKKKYSESLLSRFRRGVGGKEHPQKNNNRRRMKEMLEGRNKAGEENL